MDVKNLFNKVKSVVTDFIDSQKPKNIEEIDALKGAALLAQIEQDKKASILERLLEVYPEEMAKIFWEISAKYETWGELEENPDMAHIFHKHITFSRKKVKGNPYSQMLCQSGDYYTVSDTKTLEDNISFELLNLKISDSLELIKNVQSIYKLEKINPESPALVVYYFKQKEQIIPHFHFVE